MQSSFVDQDSFNHLIDAAKQKAASTKWLRKRWVRRTYGQLRTYVERTSQLTEKSKNRTFCNFVLFRKGVSHFEAKSLTFFDLQKKKQLIISRRDLRNNKIGVTQHEESDFRWSIFSKWRNNWKAKIFHGFRPKKTKIKKTKILKTKILKTKKNGKNAQNIFPYSRGVR